MSGAEVLADPQLARFRAALDEIYGDRIERVILYGSRARGDHRPDSDYDLAVFLDPLPNRWAEMNRLADLQWKFMEDTTLFFEAFPFRVDRYNDDSPLMHEIRREGVEV